MPQTIALEPTVSDPLHTLVALEEDEIFYPYGFPVRLRSNSSIVLEAARKSWSTYGCRYNHQPLDVRLILAGSSSPGCTDPPTFRSQGHLMSVVLDRENFASLDLAAGFAFGWATTSTAENQDYFRQCLLDVMVYPLLEVRHLITLHAACVTYGDKGILLAGDSGAGKTSLSYACARRGWTFVSDDASAYRRAAETPMVIGHPQKFRFREPVLELFPELQDFDALRTYGKLEVRTHLLEHVKTANESPLDAIVFLNRADHEGGPPVLHPVSEEEVWKRLSFSVWAVQMPAFEDRLNALRRLLGVPAFEMRYSAMSPAIDLLEDFAGQLC